MTGVCFPSAYFIDILDKEITIKMPTYSVYLTGKQVWMHVQVKHNFVEACKQIQICRQKLGVNKQAEVRQ